MQDTRKITGVVKDETGDAVIGASVVEGMPFDGDLNLINPNDIESITVLKDAASNALYGARGAKRSGFYSARRKN